MDGGDSSIKSSDNVKKKKKEIWKTGDVDPSEES